MRLRDALKKFNFLPRLKIKEEVKIAKLANHLSGTLKGTEDIVKTPIATLQDPVYTFCEWELIFEENEHKMNKPLLELELLNSNKFGPRSRALPWSDRLASLKASYTNQEKDRKYDFDKHKRLKGPGNLFPDTLEEAMCQIKMNTAASLPFMEKKWKVKDELLKNFDEILNRNDPAVIYTRTAEKRKTRNVWGFPFAQTLFEMMFFLPFMVYSKTKDYHVSLVGPEAVEKKITELVQEAIRTDRILYSVDFAAFDASVWYQIIIEAFNYVKSCFHPQFHEFIDYICERFISIAIVTPTGIYRGFHGVPSGSGFTNLIDCIVQLGIALNCLFVTLKNCIVNGDDGLYTMFRHEIKEFEENFRSNGLNLEKTKSFIATEFAVYCQRLYHIDYIKEGRIRAVYPTFRALNRLMYQEKFVNFKKIGISGKSYYAIRALTILEECKDHPLHEELVRFYFSKENTKMDISDDCIAKYCKSTWFKRHTDTGFDPEISSTDVMGIRNYKSFKLIERILAEQEEIDVKRESCI